MAINTRAKIATSLNSGNVGSEFTSITLKLARRKWTKLAATWIFFFVSVVLTAAVVLPFVTDGMTAHLISKHYKLTYLTSDSVREFYVYDADGAPVQLAKTVNGAKVTLMNQADALEIIDREIGKGVFGLLWLSWYFLWSCIATVVATYGVFLVNRWFEKSGNAQIDDEFSRGVRLITADEYKQQLVENGVSGNPLTIADIPFPSDGAERLGALFYGGAGSGKSVLFIDAMKQVLKAGKKSIIYSRTGEEYQALFRPGVDVLFAPAYKGSVKWSLFDDMRLNTDGSKFARAIIPAGKDGDFFQVAARIVFGKVLTQMYERGDTDTSAIAREIFALNDESIEELLAGTSAYNTLGKDKQRDGVLASINIHLEALTYINGGDFSLRDWVRREDDSNLFILGLPETEDVFMSLNRVCLEVVLSEIAIIGKKHSHGKYYFWLDEMPTLGFSGKGNCILTALNEMRKWGVCVMASLQSASSLYEDTGENVGKNLLNAFQTTVAMRITENETQKELAARLGDADLVLKSTNTNLAVNTDRDGAGTSAQITADVLVVKPSELSLLKAGTGYVKFVGYEPIYFDVRSWRDAGRTTVESVNEIELIEDIQIVRKPKPKLIPQADTEIKSDGAIFDDGSVPLVDQTVGEDDTEFSL